MTPPSAERGPSEVTTDLVPFAMIPEPLLYSGVSDRAVRLWCVLHRHADREGVARPGRSRLAKLMGCSVDSVDRAVKELLESEWMSVKRVKSAAGDNEVNRYTLHFAAGGAARLRPPTRTGAAEGGRTDAATGGRTDAAQTKELLNEKKRGTSRRKDAAAATPEEKALARARSVLTAYGATPGDTMTAHVADAIAKSDLAPPAGPFADLVELAREGVNPTFLSERVVAAFGEENLPAPLNESAAWVDYLEDQIRRLSERSE